MGLSGHNDYAFGHGQDGYAFGLQRDQHQKWAIRQDGYAFGLEME
jgi:hypothetical protein